MILVVVNEKKCVFFLFFRNFSVFLLQGRALVQGRKELLYNFSFVFLNERESV